MKPAKGWLKLLLVVNGLNLIIGIIQQSYLGLGFALFSNGGLLTYLYLNQEAGAKTEAKRPTPTEVPMVLNAVLDHPDFEVIPVFYTRGVRRPNLMEIADSISEQLKKLEGYPFIVLPSEFITKMEYYLRRK